ncbi:Lrp/AsnC ligand binding domain-containing protein [Sphingomonas sp. BT-65]|uniref:Lrp/AsnC ligand binding domain-containing protein n=1 Tax=Sphingomonas sp. BT-65 TaxID=2989821 RepID=UPI0022367B7C|nr:Lrp/AsnC ligand binding domain-containing protein [Sphingomonas sp. BT-65]MCW4460912.1 Lrp/AsnC ligand binding domain-containing protein [Sphingomonas sp. BT-65]
MRSIQALAGDPDLLVQVSAVDAADLGCIADAVRALPGVGEVTTMSSWPIICAGPSGLPLIQAAISFSSNFTPR